MNQRFSFDEQPQPNPVAWLEAIQKQFRAIVNMGEVDVIATYHALTASEDSIPYGSDGLAARTRNREAIRATKARMHALIAATSDKAEQKRLRKVFLEATGDASFQRLLDFLPW